MSDNISVPLTATTNVAADEISDGTLGTVKVQYVKLMDGTLDGTSKALVDTNGLAVKAVGSAASGATDSGNPVKVGGVYNSSAPTLTNGQRGDMQMDSSGNIKVNIAAGAASGGTAAVDQATFTGASTSYTPIGGVYQATPDTIADGKGSAALLDSKRRQQVVLATQIAGEDISNDLLKIAGTVAHGSADANNPVKVGSKALASPKGVTLASDANRVNAVADLDGLRLMKPYTSYGDIVSERVTNTNGTSTALTNFGAVASTRNYVTTISVYNSSATNGYLDIRDGTSGSVLFTVALPATGGSITTFPVPLRQSTANTALAYQTSGALSTVYISLVGFQSKL